MVMSKNANEKRDFIIQLFKFYKPLLSQEKQVDLINSWIESCVRMEEYEMASTLKQELAMVVNPGHTWDTSQVQIDVEEMPTDEVTTTEKMTTTELEELAEELPNKRSWTWLNYWELPDGFTLIECEFSFKKKRFRIILTNYGVEYKG